MNKNGSASVSVSATIGFLDFCRFWWIFVDLCNFLVAFLQASGGPGGGPGGPGGGPEGPGGVPGGPPLAL